MKRAREAWEETAHPGTIERVDVATWVGLLGGPAVVLAYQLIVYAMVPHACRNEAKWPMHLVSLGALAGVLMVMGLSARAWRRHGALVPRGEDSPGGGTRRLLGLVGLMVGTLSLLGVVALWIAVLLETPCKL